MSKKYKAPSGYGARSRAGKRALIISAVIVVLLVIAFVVMRFQ